MRLFRRAPRPNDIEESAIRDRLQSIVEQVESRKTNERIVLPWLSTEGVQPSTPATALPRLSGHLSHLSPEDTRATETPAGTNVR